MNLSVSLGHRHMIFSTLKRLFSSQKKEPEPRQSDFAILQNRFRMFLTAWNRFQEVEDQLEYTLCCDHPFGVYRVRTLCTDIALQVFQCIRQLRSLSPKHCPELLARFSELQKTVSALVYEPERCVIGPLLLPLEKPEGEGLVAPSCFRLAEIAEQNAELVPPGFLITAAACHRVLGATELCEEIHRRIQTAGGFLPRKLDGLSAGAEELVNEQPLDAELCSAVRAELARLRSLSEEQKTRLLFMGRLWSAEESQERETGLVLWGPSLSLDSSDEEILHAIRKTMARKYSMQALIYRRARGLTDWGSRFCISCFAVEEGSFSACVHTRSPLNPDPHGLVSVYACAGLPEEMDYLDFFAVRPEGEWLVEREESRGASMACVAPQIASRLARLTWNLGTQKSATWIVTPSGKTQIFFVHSLLVVDRQEAVEAENPLVEGGRQVSPGIGTGRAVLAQDWEDVRRLPSDPILVVEDDSYLWVALIDRVKGIIVEKGYSGSRLASLCREFGIPALFGMSDARKRIQNGERISFCAETGKVYRDIQLEEKAQKVDYMLGSPVYRILERAAEAILPFTLDPESVDFTAANCKSYHDIAAYCHVKALDAMFALGSGKREARDRVRQLKDEVVKQFWVIDLGGGFAASPKGPYVDIAEIKSVPMRSLWRGMNAYVWEGPPPVDGKGFLSVLFEATANPHLDPAAQTKFFSEKNYFLISQSYVNLQSRFGFHFVSVESRLSERVAENYLSFHLRGGAADRDRRILRVNFVGDILWEFGFQPEIRGDALTARLEGMSVEEGDSLLALAGFLTIHTRQLDMIMQDREQVERRRMELMDRCRKLYTGVF